MYVEHETGRAFIRKASLAIASGDITAITKSMTAYAALLSEHIRKEDEILYPWIDCRLTDTQVGILFSKFIDIS